MTRASLKVNLIVLLKMVPSIIIILPITALIMWLTGKIVEGIFFVVSFWLLRYKFPVTWHAKNGAICKIMTILVWGFCIFASFKTTVSILSAPFIAFIATYGLWLTQDHKNKQRKLTLLSQRSEIPRKEWYQFTDTEIRTLSLEKSLTARQTEVLIAIKKGIVGEQQIDYILSLGYDYSGSTQDREYKAIKEKLGIKSLKTK